MKVRLGDVCEINPKLNHVLSQDTEVSFVPMQSVSENGDIDSSKKRKYSEVKKGYTPFKNGDVLFAKITPCMENGKGAVANNLINGIGFGSTEFHILRPKQNAVLSSWVYYLTKWEHFRLLAEKNMTGSAGQKRVPVSFLDKYEVELCSIEQQQKQIDSLALIDSIISLRRQQLDKLDELVKSQFIEMFGDPIKKGFHISTVGECCTLKSGTSLPFEVENEGGEIPYIKVADMNLIGNEKNITTSSHYVSRKTAGCGIFPVGTVIFPKRGGAIGTNKKRLTIKEICADLNVMGVTPNKILLSSYVLAFFDQIDMGLLNNGTSVPQINNKDIAPLQIAIPPLELQNQFSKFVEQVDKSKFAIQKSLKTLESLKNALMQQYFG